jgi:hypothetical protein
MLHLTLFAIDYNNGPDVREGGLRVFCMEYIVIIYLAYKTGSYSGDHGICSRGHYQYANGLTPLITRNGADLHEMEVGCVAHVVRELRGE